MSDDTPSDPNQPNPNQPNPYGDPPPPPAVNPYAAPPPPPGASEPAPPAYGGPPPPPGYTAPTYPTGGYPGGQPKQGAGGLAITGLALAIAAGVLFWIPFLGIVLALAGLTLGIVAWATAGKNDRPKGLSIAATIVAALALVGAILVTLFVVLFWDIVRDCSDANLTSDQQQQCLEDRINDKFGIGTS